MNSGSPKHSVVVYLCKLVLLNYLTILHCVALVSSTHLDITPSRNSYARRIILIVCLFLWAFLPSFFFAIWHWRQLHYPLIPWPFVGSDTASNWPISASLSNLISWAYCSQHFVACPWTKIIDDRIGWCQNNSTDCFHHG